MASTTANTARARDYSGAVDALNSLQSNAATLAQAKWTGYRPSAAIPEMLEYLGRIGYQPEDLNKLNVIHVTGTKGKGSTCAFTDSLIRTLKPDWKVGLYTSPHLVAVRERIRVNGAPISEEDFARYFFEVWDRLEENDVRANLETASKPGYFKMLTLVAYHTFLSMKVDTTLLEVGIGGTYDSTNLVPHPIVTGVSSLGLDHVSLLGNTFAEIGWQKGGIYKEGVPALSVPQPPEGHKALEDRAKEKGASYFKVVGIDSVPGVSTAKLGLSGKHQYLNAALAVNLVRTYFRRVGVDILGESASPLNGVNGVNGTNGVAKANWVNGVNGATKASGVNGVNGVNGHINGVRGFKSKPQLHTPNPSTPEPPLAPLELLGLQNARWPGRCQTVPDPASLSPAPGFSLASSTTPSDVAPSSSKGRRLTWFLDGAHTVESLTCCVEWFANPDVGLRPSRPSSGDGVASKRKRILIFNCTSGRSGPTFLKSVLNTLRTQLTLHGSSEKAETFFDQVIFTTNITYSSGSFKSDLTAVASLPTNPADREELTKVQRELGRAWGELVPHFEKDGVHVTASLEEAVGIVRKVQEEAQEGEGELDVLVTGSLHLVGGVIEVAGLGSVAL